MTSITVMLICFGLIANAIGGYFGRIRVQFGSLEPNNANRTGYDGVAICEKILIFIGCLFYLIAAISAIPGQS